MCSSQTPARPACYPGSRDRAGLVFGPRRRRRLSKTLPGRAGSGRRARRGLRRPLEVEVLDAVATPSALNRCSADSPGGVGARGDDLEHLLRGSIREFTRRTDDSLRGGRLAKIPPAQQEEASAGTRSQGLRLFKISAAHAFHQGRCLVRIDPDGRQYEHVLFTVGRGIVSTTGLASLKCQNWTSAETPAVESGLRQRTTPFPYSSRDAATSPHRALQTLTRDTS